MDGAELALPVLILGPDVYRDLRGTTVLPSPSWGVTMTLHTPPLQLGLLQGVRGSLLAWPYTLRLNAGMV